ncbi:phosphotransferase family protein [Shewanella maritima]|uniref:phosphotransferase family protein n=1 Tax=Shewanella maritima TaxID=2520507 RepID=UPI003735BA26
MNSLEAKLSRFLVDDVITQLQNLMPAQLWQQLQQTCTTISSLSGLSNTNLQLHCIDGDKVLRINTQSSTWCNRQLETACWQQAYLQDLAPKLLWYSLNGEYYLSEYVNQAQSWQGMINDQSLIAESNNQQQKTKRLQANQQQAKQQNRPTLSSEQFIPLLTDLLVSLHKLPVPDVQMSVTQQYNDYLEQLERYSAVIVDREIAVPQLPVSQWVEVKTVNSNPIKLGCHQPSKETSWQACFNGIVNLHSSIIQWLSELDKPQFNLTFCHRDLSPDNILLTTNQCKQPKLQCIDFEYAVASHPLFDVASVVASHHFTRQQAEQLLASYVSQMSLTSIGDKQLDSALNMYWVFAAMWALLMWVNEPNKAQHYIDYFQHAIAQLTD